MFSNKKILPILIIALLPSLLLASSFCDNLKNLPTHNYPNAQFKRGFCIMNANFSVDSTKSSSGYPVITITAYPAFLCPKTIYSLKISTCSDQALTGALVNETNKSDPTANFAAKYIAAHNNTNSRFVFIADNNASGSADNFPF